MLELEANESSLSERILLCAFAGNFGPIAAIAGVREKAVSPKAQKTQWMALVGKESIHESHEAGQLAQSLPAP
jgi:hypothetical protein